MKKADMKVFKEKLLALRARLRGDFKQMAEAALHNNRETPDHRNGMPIHMADLGTDAYEQEFTLSLMQSEEDTLAAIEEALQRIEDGTYGACVECGEQIKKMRLNALPFTPLCIRCAEVSQQGR
jgi:DnaK suppressor protein